MEERDHRKMKEVISSRRQSHADKENHEGVNSGELRCELRIREEHQMQKNKNGRQPEHRTFCRVFPDKPRSPVTGAKGRSDEIRETLPSEVPDLHEWVIKHFSIFFLQLPKKQCFFGPPEVFGKLVLFQQSSSEPKIAGRKFFFRRRDE
jgi:hypothetical protein